jgi:hypothetical protein
MPAYQRVIMTGTGDRLLVSWSEADPANVGIAIRGPEGGYVAHTTVAMPEVQALLDSLAAARTAAWKGKPD